jgi:regulator of sigma E protease
MAGGVLFNFILALFIYSMVLFAWGETYVPLKNVKMGMEYSETFTNIGFQDGDILLRADDTELERFGADVLRTIIASNTVTVLRNGTEEVRIPVPDDLMQRLMRDKKGFASERIPAIVKELPSGDTPAALAGIQPGDTLISIDGVPTMTNYDFREQLIRRKGQEISITLNRRGELHTLSLKGDTAGLIGIMFVTKPAEVYQTVRISYNFFTSFPAGIKLGVKTLKGYIGDMKYVFTKEGASSLGGFGAIGSLFPAEWIWKAFWETTAFLSIILAFMNILPIPALDGGHIMFLLYEVITRRKPSDKFLEHAQIAGMIILFALLIYANGNDLFRFFFR